MIGALGDKASSAAVLRYTLFEHLVLIPATAALTDLSSVNHILLSLRLFNIERVSMAIAHYVLGLVDGVCFISENLL
jgi:hypothetical protein